MVGYVPVLEIQSAGQRGTSVIISEIQYYIRHWNLERWSDLPKATLQ